MVGVAEKGYVSLELAVDGEGGHSSMPPAATPVGILAAAVASLERHQMPAALRDPMRQFFETVGPEMPWRLRAVFANLWLTSPLVVGALTGAPATNAGVRTTTAPTMLEGSVKENVLPTRARAVVNFRILPGDSVAGVVEHARTTIGDDRVAIRTLTDSLSEPSPESPTSAPAFVRLARTVRAVFPGAVVTPALVLGATDSRHYRSLSPNVYRFLPWHATTADLHRVHGTNERLAVAEYEAAVRFYATLMRGED
jgi:carboxypeptidase PM20D1